MGAFENIEEIGSLFEACAVDKEYVWETSENTPQHEKFSARNNFICQFQEKMKKLAGDVLDLCKDLIDANKDWMYEEYKGIATDIECKAEEWNSIFQLCINDYHNIKRLERQELTGKRRYYYEKTKEEDLIAFYMNERKIICERTGNGKTEKKTLEFNDDNDVVFFYVNAKDSPEYKLCSRLSEYICNKGGYEALNRALLESLAQMVCLYIALKNEKEKLYRQNSYFLDTETKATKTSSKAKKTKQPREVFTERAKKYFEKAEEAGYLKKVGDKYKWLYRGGIVALVYFFIRIYEPESPPYERLGPLFGIKGITSSRSNLVNATWYKDEMTRQKMTPEELKLEERMQKLRKPADWFPELKNFFD